MAETLIAIPLETVKEAEELPSLTYCLDIENGRIAGKVDGLMAVNQAIRKAIIRRASSVSFMTTSTGVRWRRRLSQRTQQGNTPRQ